MRSGSFVLVTANRDLHFGFVGRLERAGEWGVSLSNARAITWKGATQLPQAFRIASEGPDECTKVSPEVSVEIRNVDLILEVTPKAEAAILALEEE